MTAFGIGNTRNHTANNWSPDLPLAQGIKFG